MGDLITICIPTYRRPSLLLHCLHSCMMQDYRPLEIDVSDNSLTDDTRDLVESLTLPDGITLRYWRNSPSIGPVDNQKKLFASARGRRFVWMNDDDLLLPGAVTAMADAFSLAPDVIVSYGIEQVVNTAGELLPDITARWNAEYDQFPEHSGLRRDLLVSALLQQIPHVGFMVLTEAARTVGIRDRAEVGLAVDADFAIRLGQTYKGFAQVFLDRATVQSRLQTTTLSKTAQDVCWQLYDIVVAMGDLSPNETRARDRLLARLGPLALREHALAYRRRAALRVLLSPTYRQNKGLVRMVYSAGLLVMPRLAFALRQLSRGHQQESWLPELSKLPDATKRTLHQRGKPAMVMPDRLIQGTLQHPIQDVLQFAERADPVHN
jgi:glycosyltransferase involved in cell wall biosynthesis